MSAPAAPTHTPFDPERYAAHVAFAGASLVFAGLVLADSRGLLVGLIGITLLLISTYTRRYGLLVVGPLATWELTRAARRRRLYLVRVLILFAVLVYLWSAFASLDSGHRHLLTGTRILPNRASRLAAEMFAVLGTGAILIALIGAVLLLSPVVAEEREASRLPHLFVTDLRNREILLGKMTARFAVLAGYIALILPVLTVLTWFGGIDPLRVVTVAAMTTAALCGITGFALVTTATAQKGADAIGATFGLCLLYLFGTFVCELLTLFAPKYLPLPNPLTDQIVGVLHFLALGNPVISVRAIAGMGATTALCHYAANQVLVLVVCWWSAVRSLRRDPQPARGGRYVTVNMVRPYQRPPVTDDPVFWHDYTLLTCGKLEWPIRYRKVINTFAAAVIGTSAGAVLVTSWFVPDVREVYRVIALPSGAYAFIVVTVPTAIIACQSVPQERAKDTLEALRLTALTPSEILTQKWRVAAAFTQTALYGMFGFWAVFVLAGALHPIGAFLAGVATVANRYLAASIGMRVGLTARTPAKAIGFLITFAVAYAFVVAIALTPLDALRVKVAPVYVVLVPPAGQCVAASVFEGRSKGLQNQPLVVLAGTAGGLLVAAGVSRWAWQSSCRRFERMMTPEPDGATAGGPNE